MGQQRYSVILAKQLTVMDKEHGCDGTLDDMQRSLRVNERSELMPAAGRIGWLDGVAWPPLVEAYVLQP